MAAETVRKVPRMYRVTPATGTSQTVTRTPVTPLATPMKKAFLGLQDLGRRSGSKSGSAQSASPFFFFFFEVRAPSVRAALIGVLVRLLAPGLGSGLADIIVGVRS